MSKRGSKSAIKTNQAKSISGGSGKNLAPWLTKKKSIKPTLPTKEELTALQNLGITLIEDPEQLDISQLKIKASAKILELTKIEKERKPLELNLDKKNKQELIRMIHIIQNRMIEFAMNST